MVLYRTSCHRSLTHQLIFALMVMCLGVMSSCSEDEVDDIKGLTPYDGKVKVSLTTRANTGDYVPGFLQKELISTYRVVFSNNDGDVVAVADGSCSPTAELKPFDVQLSPGKYNVYGFANISYDYLDGLGLKKGGKVPSNLATLRYNIPNLFNDAKLPSASGYDGYIPMTGICPQQVEVTGRVTQTFGVEVRRLFAKIEFVFQNSTGRDIQLNALSIGNLTVNTGEGTVLLMNYEESRDYVSLPSVSTSRTLTHTYSTPLLLKKDTTSVSQAFYVLESRASTITNSFQLDFNITKEEVTPSGSEYDYMRYGLTDPSTITLIHRNDWIRIPINLSDWQMRLEARSYPPIGGYPEAEIEELEDNEFVVFFKGGGEFSIRPFIRKYGDGSDWFGIDDKKMVVGTPTISVEDLSNLFQKTPSLTNSGEIIGTMRAYPGLTACITISLQVNVSATITKTLKRKIYVTQK